MMNKNKKRVIILTVIVTFLCFTAYLAFIGYKISKKFLWNQHISSFMPVSASVYDESDPVEAVKRASGLIAKDPRDARAYYLRGSAYGFLHKQKMADDDYRMAVEYGADNIVLLNAISYRYYYFLYMPGQSLQISEAALGLDPDSVDANINNGRALIYLARYDEGLKALDKAIDNSFNCARAYEVKMMAYSDMRRYDEGLVTAEKLTEIRPDEKDYQYAKAYFLIALNRLDDALKYIDETASRGGRNKIRCYKAFALLRRNHNGDREEANGILNSVLKESTVDEAAPYAYALLGERDKFIKLVKEWRFLDTKLEGRNNILYERYWKDPDFLEAVKM